LLKRILSTEQLLVVAKLTTNSSSNEVNSVRVGKETFGIRNDLADVEAIGLVFARCHVGDVDEEGAL
jgi:hypothetical protein